MTRSGLGVSGVGDFRRKVVRVLEDYVASTTKDDLVFSPDFTKDERKLIHELVTQIFIDIHTSFE